jgi:hypothetical protein
MNYLKKLTPNSQENKKPSQEEMERAYLRIINAKNRYVASELLFIYSFFLPMAIFIETHLVFL